MSAHTDDARTIAYERRKLITTLVSLALSFAIPLAFLLSGGSEWLRDIVTDWTGDSVAAAAGAYALLALVALQVLESPIELYSGYLLERQFGLSRVGLRSWLFDWLKGFALQLALLVVVTYAVYGLIASVTGAWWIIAAAGMSAFVIFLAAIAPVFLFRIFYKFEPLPDGELRQRLVALTDRLGVQVRGVYIWKLGEKTRKANAALAGWGRTRRILLSDTLVEEHTVDEIEVILAHEIAHQVHWDIWKGIAVQSALIFVGFFAVDLALNAWTSALGLTGPADVAGMPLLVLVVSAVTLAALPMANGLSRRFEHSADVYALEVTGMRDQFISAMDKLAEQNMARRRPNPIVEFVFHSHPSIDRRIRFAREWNGDVS